MGNKNAHTNNFLNENTTTTPGIKTLDTVFKNKLTYRANILKKDNSLSVDDKILKLQKSIENYCNKTILRIDSYYSPLFTQVQKDIDGKLYPDLLNYIEEFDNTIYQNLLKKISIDKTLKLEVSDFNTKSVFDDLADLVDWVFDKIFRERDDKNKKIENELLNRESEVDKLHSEFTKRPETAENLEELKKRFLQILPETLKKIIDTLKKMIESLKGETSKSEDLRKILS